MAMGFKGSRNLSPPPIQGRNFQGGHRDSLPPEPLLWSGLDPTGPRAVSCLPFPALSTLWGWLQGQCSGQISPQENRWLRSRRLPKPAKD